MASTSQAIYLEIATRLQLQLVAKIASGRVFLATETHSDDIEPSVDHHVQIVPLSADALDNLAGGTLIESRCRIVVWKRLMRDPGRQATNRIAGTDDGALALAQDVRLALDQWSSTNMAGPMLLQPHERLAEDNEREGWIKVEDEYAFIWERTA